MTDSTKKWIIGGVIAFFLFGGGTAKTPLQTVQNGASGAIEAVPTATQTLITNLAASTERETSYFSLLNDFCKEQGLTGTLGYDERTDEIRCSGPGFHQFPAPDTIKVVAQARQ